MDRDNQVASGSAVKRGLALAAQTHALAVLDSLGNLDGHRLAGDCQLDVDSAQALLERDARRGVQVFTLLRRLLVGRSMRAAEVTELRSTSEG